MKLRRVLLSCLLIFALTAVCLIALPMDAQAASESDLTFTLNEDGESYSVRDCNWSAGGSLEIPATYNGKPVTSIGDEAFEYCSSLTSITIPDSVTSIGDIAFMDCSSLTSVTIGNGVTSIGFWAFRDCSSLTSVTIGDSVTSIGEAAFYGCSSLTYNTYDNGKYLGNSENPYVALVEAVSTSITSCQIHEDTKIIAKDAFSNCSSLTSVTIPDSVTSIGNHAFYWCSSLTSVTIPDSVTSIGRFAFSFSGLTSITIPDSVTAIPDCAFYNCSSLTSVTIPDSVTSIGDHAFEDCWLTSVFYSGSKVNKAEISIDGNNGNFINATWHYEPQESVFAGQACLYCADCDNYFLNDGSYAKATVTFKNWDGSVIHSGTYHYREAVDVPANPTKPSDNTYNYVFDSWGKGVDYTCFGNETYQAEFRAEYINYPVIFVDEDGSVILSKTYHWEDEVEVPADPTKAEDDMYTYTFAGWHKPVSDVCKGNITYQATYTPTYKEYTVIFADEDGREISSGTYHWGQALDIPADPTKPSDNVNDYIFTGWNCPLYCSGNATYTASYAPSARSYVVQFLNEDGSPISYKTYYWGDAIEIPVVPAKPADETYTYAFAGWDKTIAANCAGDATYIAKYSATYKNYIVMFKNWDGAILSAETYHYGDKVTAPANPTKAANDTYTYTFAGWDKPLVTNCVDNAVYTAIYTSTYKNYTVVFKNWDGTVLSTKTYHYGDKVTAPANPTRAADNAYTYTFKGWDKTVADCTGDVTYTATYNATVKEQPEPTITGVMRVFGADRYNTAFKAADTLKTVLGVEKFQNVIVASGTGFADALAGSYLAAVKDAPILLVRAANVNAVKDYIKKNLASGGTVYLLGGVNAVPKTMETGLDGFKVKRLGGATRYDTNLLILKEAGVAGKDIIVCTGKNFADSLSASATGLPILLVKDSLSASQQAFLASTSGKKIVVGGTAAVNVRIENALKAYGSVKRLAGNTRYDTSVLVAKEFFESPTTAVLAYAQNFPDGLSGGALAYALNAPLILTDSNKPTAAVNYGKSFGIKGGYVLGGTGLISDKVVKNIFSMAATDKITVK